VQWIRDNFGLITKSSGIETLARTVKDNGGVYFVPAFSGLYAPYWKTNAAGVIAGSTRQTNKGHLAPAVLEATAFQTREVVEAMEKDSGIALDVLRTDGGIVENDLLMQFQADILNRPVVRPVVKETTALSVDSTRTSMTCARNGQWITPGNRTWTRSSAKVVRFVEESGNTVVRLARFGGLIVGD